MVQAVDIKAPLTVEHLREVLDYDSATGVFAWRVTSGRAVAGVQAGSVDNTGYRRIWIDGRRFLAHRLAWLYVHGAWPAHQVDHIDGDRDNNSLANLRAADTSQNKANGRTYKKTCDLPKGVTHVGQRYGAQIRCQSKLHWLGTYDTPEAAHAAYLSAAEGFFGDYARAA